MSASACCSVTLRLQSPDDAVVVHAAEAVQLRAREADGHEQVGRLVVAKRTLAGEHKRPGHHADDGIRTAIDHHRAADDRRIGAERSPPQSIAQHDHRATALVLLQGEGAPQDGCGTEDVEQRRRGAKRGDALRSIDARQLVGLRDIGREAVEAPCAFLERAEIRRGERDRTRVRPRDFLEDHDQPRGVPERQRLQKHRIHHGEHARRGADRQPQREDDCRRETGASKKNADRVADIVAQPDHDRISRNHLSAEAVDAPLAPGVAAEEQRRHHDVEHEPRPRVGNAQPSEARALAAHAVFELLVELVLVNASITREQQEEQAAHPVHAFSSRLRRAASTNPARRSASAAPARRPAAVIFQLRRIGKRRREAASACKFAFHLHEAVSR